MWTACCHGAKSIDFRDSPQSGEKGPLRAFGLAREGKLNIWASAWRLSCHRGISLAAELAPVELLSRHCGTSLAAEPLPCPPKSSSFAAELLYG